MKHNGTLRRGLSILLSLVLCLGLLPATALAEGEDAEVSPKAIQLGADCISGYDSETGYDYLYYGYWNSDDTKAYSGPIKWRVLDTKTNMDGAKEGDGLFLLSDDLLCESSSAANQFKVSYHRDSDSNSESYGKYYRGEEHEGGHENCQLGNEWQGSSAQAWCQAFYSNSLTAQEQSAVLATTKSDKELSYTAHKINGNGEGYVEEDYALEYAAADGILNGEMVFFLSAEEAVTAAYGFAYGSDGDSARKTATSNYWSLRSPVKSVPVGVTNQPTANTGAINFYGQMYMQSAIFAGPLMTTRPAFNLDPDAVLFTSAVEGGKNADGMNGALTAVADCAGHEWKLTLKDSDRSDFTASVTARSGNMVMVEYENAITGANEFISALVIDEDGNISYYGRIAQPTGAGGRVYITLPEGFDEDTDTLFVFNEQYNGAQMTDCASDLVEVALTGDLPSLSVFNRAIRIGADDIHGYDQINGYSYLYFGNWEAPDEHTTTGPIKWLVLDTKTNMKDAEEGDGLFLLSEAVLGSGQYGNVYFNQSCHKAEGIWYKGAEHDGDDHTDCQIANAWQGSDAQAWCRDFYGSSLTEQEQAAVLATTKSDGEYSSYSFSSTRAILFGASDDILKNDTVFFLSTEEAENGAYGFPDNASRGAVYDDNVDNGTRWWLRSPVSEETATVGVVHTKGVVASWTVYNNWAARPAFNLDPDAVLFASVAVGGKSAGGMDSGLTAVEDYIGREWKVTLLDSDRDEFAASTTEISGDTVTVRYKNAITGANEYISAIVRDEYGSVSYYGRIAQPSSASGTVSITLPEGFDKDTDTLFVFNEQYNGDKMTDYASALCPVDTVVSIESCTVVGGEDGVTPVTAPTVGQKLTANVETSVGTFGSYPVNEQLHYTWHYEGSDAVLGTAPVFTVTSDNLDKVLVVDVTSDDMTGSASWKASKAVAYINIDGVSVVDGEDGVTPVTAPTVGQKLTANVETSVGTFGSYPVNKRLHYTWHYEGSDAVLGTAPVFTVTSDNLDKVLVVDVTGDDMTGSASWKASKAVMKASNPVSTSGGGSSSPSYAITVDKTVNGTADVSSKTAKKGASVTITITPDAGYTLETLTVTDASGKEVTLTEKSGKYTFTMPASKVTVKATFMEDNSMLNFFVDVPADAYYYDAVLWAAENGITGGVDDTHFAPNAPCTRAQIVTFLWRAAGSPEPENVSSFADVSADSYYAKAVAWAVENGITTGTGDGMFSPNATCTRAQAMAFIWRSQKSVAADGANPFTDVAADAYYAKAVLWAVENGITNGTSDTTFSPNANCTRAQIVTFLYRCLG